MQQLYRVVTIPKLLYAVDIWLTPVHQKLHARKSSSSVGTTNRFVSLQHTAALAITGALRSTATDVLNLHAGLLPMALALWQACFWVVLRLVTLPKTHPLHPLFHTWARHYIKSHRSLLHELVLLLGTPPHGIECITLVRPMPAHELKMKICLSKPSEEMEDTLWGNQICIHLFSDGLGLDGGIGPAAVMYKLG